VVSASGGTMHSRAELATTGADRWVRRLAAQLAAAETSERADERAVEQGVEQGVEQVAEEAGWTVLRLAGGSCAMSGTGDTLVLEASAPDAATLTRVQDVVGRHLEQLAADEGLRVGWVLRPE
jgi:hypothetical protein